MSDDDLFIDADDVSWIDLLNSFSVSMSDRVRHHVDKQRKKLKLQEVSKLKNSKHLTKLRQNTSQKFKRLEDLLATDLIVSKTEKTWYTMSLLFIFFFGWVCGVYPHHVHLVYTAVLGLLLPVRFFTYYRRKFHYYLADLCYFVNGLLLLFIWVYPNSQYLWASCFSFSFGTLSFAIITWRNSLVLHSIDKTTSTIIHIMPPVVCHTLNHRLPFFFKSTRFPAIVEVKHWHVGFSVFSTTVMYFGWQTLYHYFITWRSRDKIKAGQVTSFEFLRKAYGKTWIGRFVNGLPGPLPVLAFTMIQFSYQMGTMLPCPLWYRYETLSSVFLVIIFAAAAYNGATYYIDFYGNRFRKELLKARKELEEMEASLDAQHSQGQEEQIIRNAIQNIDEETEKRIKKDKNLML